MKVFKFGGASLRDALAIRNVASIIRTHFQEDLLVVVSAIGKTTDGLEQVVSLAQSGRAIDQAVESLLSYHLDIARSLFPAGHPIFLEIDRLFLKVREEAIRKGDYDQVYDQVVSLGEIVCSVIVSQYLLSQNIPTQWLDARTCIQTDSCCREGKVNWEVTQQKIKLIKSLTGKGVLLTQGFIGSTPDGLTTTLGREGSDFSAAIFASCLNAESLTIWKDVAGVMNADPKRLPAATVFEELPFREAAEMTYYGASIIHPKTIKPLANKGIPLYVKSFVHPAAAGTIIHECQVDHLPPLIVFKDNQCLISCKVTDYSFIDEQQIGIIFQTLSENNIKINVMQNSAISFSFCVDFRETKILNLIHQLGKNFEVYYNTGLTLITIKNYTQRIYEEYRNRPGVILEQSSRSTLQVLLKAK